MEFVPLSRSNADPANPETVTNGVDTVEYGVMPSMDDGMF